MKIYQVLEDNDLMNFLSQFYSKKQVKVYLKNKEVLVNGKVVSQYNYGLKKGDQVSLQKRIDEDIPILYEDKDLIIVEKPYHLLTISDLKEKEKTLYSKVSTYLKEQHKGSHIFIVHRLDYETSGLVVFAKNKETKEKLQANWQDVKRGYQAVVHGKLDHDGELVFHLKETKSLMVYVTKKSKDTKKAITNYQVIQSNENYSLVDIDILTGRKNQIRVSFKEIGHPILGDKKYGIKDKEKHLYLYANRLIFSHPKTKKMISIFLTTPKDFSRFF